MEKGGPMPLCYGIMWDASASECGPCLARVTCERMVRMRADGAPTPVESSSAGVDAASGSEPVDVESAGGEEIQPLEYLLRSIEKEYSVEESEDNGLRMVKFRNKEGALIVRVSISDTGRVKCQSAKGKVVLEGIDTIDIAKEVLHELLG